MSTESPDSPQPFTTRQIDMVGRHRNIAPEEDMTRALLQAEQHARDRLVGAFKDEVKMPVELINAVSDIQDGALELGRDLGLDLGDALPEYRHYHFFRTQEAVDAALDTAGSQQPRGRRGYADRSIGIILKLEDDDPEKDAWVLAHELGHYIARLRAHVTLSQEGGAGANVQVGYNTISNTSEELFTDFTAIEIMRRSGRPLKQIHIGYPYSVIIASHLLDKAAKAHKPQPISITDLGVPLLRGRLTGEMGGMHNLSQIIGPAHMKIFLQMEPSPEPAVALQTAKNLDLPQAVTALETCIGGGAITIHGLVPRRHQQP
jgi:hypothetical protein